MTLKDLFNKNSGKVIRKTSLEDQTSELESKNYELELLTQKNRFISKIDFSEPQNFTKFGSAEKYYHDAITSVYTSYPYDGSLYEKLKWQNSNSDISNYVFENYYPRTNGYINFGYSYGSIILTDSGYSTTSNPEYIFVKGGPNQSEEETLKKKFAKANKLENINNRNYNLYINGDTGFTTEFWFKKETTSSQSNKQVIFDLWNSGTVSNTSFSPYGRFRIEFSTSSLDQLNVIVRSGSEGTSEAGVLIGSNLNLTASSWSHYALNISNSGSQLKIDLYKNGDLNSTIVTGSFIKEVTGSYIATIGSLITKHETGATTDLGYGKLEASLDEFRFWKSKRNDKQIKRYWFTQVGGGTNTDDANTSLGLYYKFNEGIYDTNNISSYDKRIIDYSGRISNGIWTGYVIGSRNTGSALIESKASNSEFKDPILYSSHPDVVSLLSSMKQSGSQYDLENNAAIINTFPEWMLEEDNEQLKNLTQISAEFFDDLYLKIKSLTDIKDITYYQNNEKPTNFSVRLLESHGFLTSDMFTDLSIFETFLSRNEQAVFINKTYDLKNIIYQNIFNNLNYIYRSKGTEKSIRNFLTCFGVDENLIKINLYANDSTFTFEDRYSYGTSKKKYIDFNNVDRFSSTIYQTSSVLNINSLSYIPGNSQNSKNGTSLECEAIFPKKYDVNTAFYVEKIVPKVSLFGLHSANPSSPGDLTWYSGDEAGFQVYLNTYENDNELQYFSLTSSFFGLNITSSNFREIYNNEKWNFSLNVYNNAYELNNVINNVSQSYVVELVGYNTSLDVINNSFSISASIPEALAQQYFNSAKRIYAGAHRQNFTGSLLEKSDAYISSIRFWVSKLSNKALLEHSKDPLNYGAENPYENVSGDSHVSADETLVLHWNFENVTGSDNGSGIGPSNTSDGKFIVEDITSGSINDVFDSNWIRNINKYQFLGTGDFFLRNDSSVVRREMISSAKRKLPEALNDANMINILSQDDLTFTRDSAPVSHYFTLEKSMYQVISDEMIKMLGTFISFNNLIGEPIDRYKQDYKKLNKLREMFFDKIKNEIEIEKYIEFFKWFDSSIGLMAEQLIPASANFPTVLKTVIESHILERNKYWNKYPTLEFKKELPIDAVNGINELKYNWKNGHAPISGLETENCLWWNLRAHASGSLNVDRKSIIDSKFNSLNRKFNTMYDFNIEKITIMDARPKRTDFVKPVVKFSSNSYLSIDADEVSTDTICNDD